MHLGQVHVVTAQTPGVALALLDWQGMVVLTGTVLRGMVPREASRRGMLPKGMSRRGSLVSHIGSIPTYQSGAMVPAQLHPHGMSLWRVHPSLLCDQSPTVSKMRAPDLAGFMGTGRAGMTHKSRHWSQ